MAAKRSQQISFASYNTVNIAKLDQYQLGIFRIFRHFLAKNKAADGVQMNFGATELYGMCKSYRRPTLIIFDRNFDFGRWKAGKMSKISCMTACVENRSLATFLDV